eukprot:7386745-Prymnesium_polylepis.1
MEFCGAAGPCVIVDASGAGQRLQGFVARAFREQLGRCAGHIHVACRHAARSVVEAGSVLVNGSAAAGRHVLQAGDVVTLAAALVDPTLGAAPQESRSRMALGFDEDLPDAEDARTSAPAAAEARAAFRAYYEAQGLWEPH